KVYQPELQKYRDLVNSEYRAAIEKFSGYVNETSGGDPTCKRISDLAADYLHWMSWALGDLPYLAIAVQPDLDNVRRSLGACCLLYVAGRLIDDLADPPFL